MNKLERNLCEQFSLKSCLTGSQLDWGKTHDFQILPSSIVSKQTNTLFSDAFFDKNKHAYGEGFESIGFINETKKLHLSEDKNAFLFGILIKTPDNNYKYSLPRQLGGLESVISIFSRDFAEKTPYADTYFCGLMYRSLPIAKSQIAEDWHTHKAFSSKTISEKRLLNLEIPSNAKQMFECCESEMMSIEYIVSDTLGSLFQSKKTNVKLIAEETESAYSIVDPNEALKIPYRQLDDGEIAKGNNYVFHRAAAAPIHMIGKQRHLLVASFVPSHLTHRALRLNE